MEQLSIFDLLAESKPLPINIKLLSLFSGIGAFEKALDNLGISYELVGYCEIDKYASKSYSAIHGVSEDMNLWDVTKVDEKALPKDIDLITYGFPCQDISLAGKQKGLFNEDGSKTRSGLFFDALRIIEETQPRVAIAENVKNLTGKKFNAQFQVVLASLESAGYNNYWQVLNAKDYGVPQNRERVFIVSIRKDIDKGYTFPKGFPLEKRLKDVLEETVDEKYYLSDKMIDYISQNGTKNFRNADCKINCAIARPLTTDQNKRAGTTNYLSKDLPENFDISRINVVGRINSLQDGVVVSSEGIAPTHTAGHGNAPKIVEPTINQVGQIYPNSGNPQAGRIYDAEGISPTMDTCSGGNRMPKVVEPKVIGAAPMGNAGGNSYLYQLGNLRIRKLTPKECFRLMGFDDSDFHKAELVNSNTQLYKQAGNSIVVDVLEHLLSKALKVI